MCWWDAQSGQNHTLSRNWDPDSENTGLCSYLDGCWLMKIITYMSIDSSIRPIDPARACYHDVVTVFKGGPEVGTGSSRPC